MDGTNDNRGLECPKCGCKHFEFSYSKDVPGARERVKRCRHCNTRILSIEAIKRILPPTPADLNNSAGRMGFDSQGLAAEF